jgi:hypothetical protein
MIVYKLTFPNGKSYIGQTVRDLQTRIGQHGAAAKAGSLLAVHCAWRKHGEPTAEVVATCESTDELHRAEIDAIKRCGTLAPGGYNLGYGGETAPSKNPEVAAKIAAKAKGRRVSDAVKARLTERSAANWQTEGYREKVAAGVARAWTPERRAAAGERLQAAMAKRRAEGWTLSQESRQKISDAMRSVSDETRAKMSAAAKARVREPFTEQTCERLAVSVAASWQDPDIRARRSAAIREGHRLRKERLQQAREA